jgi:ATP-dependent RNA helicase DeaD
MAEDLGDEYSPTDLAAAAFKLLLGAPPDEAEDVLAQSDEPEEYRGNGKKKRPKHKRERGERPTYGGPEVGMTRLFIDVGREDNVRPGDIVGAIANEADIPGRSIGAIELYDHFAFVDVPSNQSEKVLRALKHTTIRGRKIAPSVARPLKTRG